MIRPFVCTALLCLATACGPGPAPDRGAASTAGPGAADVVTVAYSATGSNQDGARALEILVGLLADERLVGLSRDGRAEPRLAERWDVSPDGLTWRFTLRRNLTFQNGQPLTSAEVRKAIEPNPGAPAATAWPGLRDVVAVETPSPLEIVVRLKKPNALLLEGLNLSQVTAADGAGAGPFVAGARTPSKATLRSFDRYFRGRSAIAAVSIAEYPSQREAWSAMMRGEVDVLFDVAPEAFEFVRESPNAHIASYLRPYVTALTFNSTHPRLGRREVRRAVNQAIDRRAVIETILGGRGVAAVDPIWPNHWARDAAAPTFTFDVPAARAALDAAGLRRPAGPQPRPRFAFTCLVPAAPLFERLALLIQRQLLAIDVDMRLEALPLSELQARVAAGRYDAFLFELVASHGLGFTHLFWHSQPVSMIQTGYTSANADLDRIIAARTDDETRAAVQALQRTLHDDPPAAFLYWPQVSRAVSRRIVLPAGDDVDVLRSLDRWRIVARDPAGSAP